MGSKLCQPIKKIRFVVFAHFIDINEHRSAMMKDETGNTPICGAFQNIHKRYLPAYAYCEAAAAERVRLRPAGYAVTIRGASGYAGHTLRIAAFAYPRPTTDNRLPTTFPPRSIRKAADSSPKAKDRVRICRDRCLPEGEKFRVRLENGCLQCILS